MAISVVSTEAVIGPGLTSDIMFPKDTYHLSPACPCVWDQLLERGTSLVTH